MKRHGFIFIDLLLAIVLSMIFIPFVLSSILNLIHIHSKVISKAKTLTKIQNGVNSYQYSNQYFNKEKSYNNLIIFKENVDFNTLYWIHQND